MSKKKWTNDETIDCRDHEEMHHIGHTLLPVHVDRRGPVSVTASGGHVVAHRILGVGDDLPEGELHVLVAGQGEVDAGIFQPV